MKRIAMLIAAGLFSQVASAEMVIGTIDFQQLSPYINKMQQDAVKADPSLKNDYAAMQKHLAALKTKASTDQSKMTDEQKKLFNIELSNMKAEFSKESMTMSSRMVKSQTETMAKLQDTIVKHVAEVAKQRHVNAVFPKNVLVYSDSSVDLTADVMKKLS